jgi:clan AA aspartic protease (TIGR02281 family)
MEHRVEMTDRRDLPVEVGFELRSNLILLQALVNGVGQTLLLDTGASQTVIDTSSAAALGLEPSGDCDTALGAGGAVAASLATVNTVDVGGATIENIGVAVLDIAALSDQIGGPIDGILGFNFLRHFKIQIDYHTRTLGLLRVDVGDTENSQ